jgi:hypothetical protein
MFDFVGRARKPLVEHKAVLVLQRSVDGSAVAVLIAQTRLICRVVIMAWT